MARKSKSGSSVPPVEKSSAWVKNDVVTVRLKPKLKFGLELLSRKQHRNISSLVTWAIEQVINDPENGLYKKVNKGLKISEPKQMLDVLWDVDPADRLVKIATHWPELMNYYDELLVRHIQKEGWGWPEKGDLATDQLRQMFSDIIWDPGSEKYYWNG